MPFLTWRHPRRLRKTTSAAKSTTRQDRMGGNQNLGRDLLPDAFLLGGIATKRNLNLQNECNGVEAKEKNVNPGRYVYSARST